MRDGHSNDNYESFGMNVTARGVGGGVVEWVQQSALIPLFTILSCYGIVLANQTECML